MTQRYDRYWMGRMHRRATIETPVSSLYVGWCPTCNAPRHERAVRQVFVEVERDECCLYACRVCDSTIDESVAPF
jgi:hypothetical protein